MSLITISAAFIFNFIFFLISQRLKIKIFFKYFSNFIIYSLILFLFLYLSEYNFLFKEFFSFIVLYILFFISLFLTISAKYLKSPTYLIFNFLKKKRKKNEIINYLRKKKIILLRFEDLDKQGIILLTKNKIKLKNKLGLFINILFILKKFLKLKSEG